MKINLKCKWITDDDGIQRFMFPHYHIKKSKGKHTWYEICSNDDGVTITSSKTLNDACKKIKLLEIGYKRGREDTLDTYCPEHNWLRFGS